MKTSTTMKTRIIVTILASVAFLSGCASTGRNAQIQAPTVVVEATPMTFTLLPASLTPPEGQADYVGANAYARGLLESHEYELAAYWFEQAAQVRTTDRVWEFENLLNASVAYDHAGNRSAAVRTLTQAESIGAHLPPNTRTRYLSALAGGPIHPGLPARLRTTFPR